MKKPACVTIVCLLLLPTVGLTAAPLGTAFTYQGRLNSAAPAHGTLPMTFSLWDNSTGGSNVGTPSFLSRNASVANWVFTVDLDFGTAAFSGDARWLEIHLNGVLQSPRTRVAPTPNAIYASTAGGVKDGAITSGNLADNAITAGKIASGHVVKSISVNGSGNLRDVVNLAAGNNITLTPNGNTVTIASSGSGGSGPWLTLNNNAYYNGGNVGIGTTTPSSKLQVDGNVGLSGDLFVGRTLRIPGEVLGPLRANQGELIVEDVPGSTIPNPPYRFVVQATGNVGIGTRGPTEKLHVAGRFLRVDGMAGEAAYIGGDGVGNDVQVGSLNPSVTEIFMYNAGSQTHMNTHVGTLTIHGGADLAEPFTIKEDAIEKGSVVVIDDEHPGRLKRSTQAYDTRVAGIVSGANGIHPGIALRQEGALDQGENVALSGRVYVRADASHGAIKPGDLLTTSDTPGHAMKVADSTRAQGAILGKAMTSLGEGQGLVLVLVTLQ